MPMDMSGWSSFAQKDLSVIFADQHQEFPSMIPYLYRLKEAEQGTEYDIEVGGLGAISEFTGEISYQEPTESYKRSVSETQYASGLKVTRRLMRNDLYGIVQDEVANLADQFRVLIETQAASPFVNGFGSFVVGDTLSLFNTAHTSDQGGANQSNSGTAAFSVANVEAVKLLVKKFRTNRDQVMSNIPDMLIIPMDLDDDAYEIIKSMGKVDTSLNNRNYHEGRYKVVVWDNFLTDTNNWFMVNSGAMRRQLILREWEPTTFFKSGEFDGLTSKFAGYTSFGISSVGWRWGYGSNVS